MKIIQISKHLITFAIKLNGKKHPSSDSVTIFYWYRVQKHQCSKCLNVSRTPTVYTFGAVLCKILFCIQWYSSLKLFNFVVQFLSFNWVFFLCLYDFRCSYLTVFVHEIGKVVNFRCLEEYWSHGYFKYSTSGKVKLNQSILCKCYEYGPVILLG